MIDVLDFLDKTRNKYSLGSIVSEENNGLSNKTMRKLGKTPEHKLGAGKPTKEEMTKETPLIYENTIDEIIVQLHKVAVSKLSLGGLRIVNSAFDDPVNPTKLVSTGEHIISVTPDKVAEDSPGVDKENALKLIQTYVQWFIGPDASKKITDKNVYPIVNENTSADDKKEADNREKDLKAQKEKLNKAKEDTSKSKGKIPESMSSLFPKFSRLLVEDNEDTVSKDEDMPEKDKKLAQNDSTKRVDSSLTSKDGFYTIYQLDSIPGKKDTTLQDVTKKLAKSIFRNIAGFNWWTGSAGKTIGEIQDDLDSIFGKIDPDKLVSEVNSEFKKRLPKLDPHVSVWDSKTLLTRLSKLLDKKDKLKIQPVKYSLTIRLNDSGESEKAAEKVIKNNLQIVADVVNKSITGFVKRVKFHLKPEHIISVRSGEDREQKQIVQYRRQISDMLKKLKKDPKKLKEFQDKEKKLSLNVDYAGKENDAGELEKTYSQFRDYIEKNNIRESVLNQSYKLSKMLLEGEPNTENDTSDPDPELDDEDLEQTEEDSEVVDKKLGEADKLLKKSSSEFFKDEKDVTSYAQSSSKTQDILNSYDSSIQIDSSIFDSTLVVEVKSPTKEYSKEDVSRQVFDDVFSKIKYKKTGEVIEATKKEALNSSQKQTFSNLYKLIFEDAEDKDPNEITKEDLDKITKEFEKISKSKLPDHDVTTFIGEPSELISEMKKNKVGDDQLYGKIKDSKVVFSINAKAKNALKESLNSLFELLDLILEAKSPRETFIGKLAHAISLKPDFLDSNKDKIQSLNVDDNIKKYLQGAYKQDLKDGKLNKNTHYFDKITIPKRDQAFKEATSKVEELLNSTDEKKKEDEEAAKVEQEKKDQEKQKKEESKPELEKFKSKLEEILKKNPKFFEKYKSELEKADINKKIKTYLQTNIKDDYDGEHLKTTAFLKKNISDDELKDSLEKVTKFYDEYKDSDEGKKEAEDNSKEDAKMTLKNNLDDKVIKDIFDQLLKDFPNNIKTSTTDFFIANGEVDEKKEITKINAEWSTTYSHDQQKSDTKDNGTIQKEEVKGESALQRVANVICEDLNKDFDIFLLERSEFNRGQLSKDKVAYKQKIEAGLDRVHEVMKDNEFSKYLDIVLRQYKSSFPRNYDKNVKSGNLKAALLDKSKFTDSLYNDFTRGELFAITVILRVILYTYYFTNVGSYAIMPGELVSEAEEKKSLLDKIFVAPFKLDVKEEEKKEDEKKPEETKVEEPSKNGEDTSKEKFNFFIIPMKGLDYKDSDDERMQKK